jgi:hypothetical protein
LGQRRTVNCGDTIYCTCWMFFIEIFRYINLTLLGNHGYSIGNLWLYTICIPRTDLLWPCAHIRIWLWHTVVGIESRSPVYQRSQLGFESLTSHSIERCIYLYTIDALYLFNIGPVVQADVPVDTQSSYLVTWAVGLWKTSRGTNIQAESN